MSHMHTHGGHAAAARRRGEQWLGCTRCGIRHDRIRYQAAPNRPPSPLAIAIGLLAQLAAAVLVAAVAFGFMVGLLIGGTPA